MAHFLETAFGRLIACVVIGPSLAGCAADGRPHYCQQGVVERGMQASGYNPAMLGPALIVSGLMELGCKGDGTAPAAAPAPALPEGPVASASE